MNTSEAKQPFPASLQSLFAPLTRAKFIEEFWGQHPLALSQSAQDFRGLANWDALAAIVAQSESDILVVRKGERYSGAVPHCISELRTLINDGFTVLVRHAERHDGRLRQLASELTSTFHAEADVHIYATPAAVRTALAGIMTLRMSSSCRPREQSDISSARTRSILGR